MIGNASRHRGRRVDPLRRARVDDGSGVDPAIMGLLRRLPAPGTTLSAKKRKVLIDAFTAAVAFLYPETDNDE